MQAYTKTCMKLIIALFTSQLNKITLCYTKRAKHNPEVNQLPITDNFKKPKEKNKTVPKSSIHRKVQLSDKDSKIQDKYIISKYIDSVQDICTDLNIPDSLKGPLKIQIRKKLYKLFGEILISECPAYEKYLTYERDFNQLLFNLFYHKSSYLKLIMCWIIMQEH